MSKCEYCGKLMKYHLLMSVSLACEEIRQEQQAESVDMGFLRVMLERHGEEKLKSMVEEVCHG